MKHLSSIIFFIQFLLLFPNVLQAQKFPLQLKEKIEGKTNLQEIMQEVETYYQYGKAPELFDEKGDEIFETPYLRWKRMEYFLGSRLDNNGNIYPNINQKVWENWNSYNILHPDLSNTGPGVNSSYGSWSSIGPTSIVRYGDGWNSGYGRVNCIAFHPSNADIFYIGTPQAGIWRTTDGGTNYSILTDDLPSVGISGLVVSWANANTLYALTGDGDVSHGNFITSYGFDQKSVGVLKSTDAGATWFITGELPNAGATYYGYKLIQHPTNSNTLFAATTAGIYRTTDGGNIWAQVETDTRFTDIEFKPGSPNTMYAVRRMDGGGGTNTNPFYRSTNGGVTWSNAGIVGLTTTAERLAIGVSANNANYVYLLTGPATGSGSFKGIFRSTNSGLDFGSRTTTPNILGYPAAGTDEKDQTFYDLCMDVAPNNVSTIITGGINIWKSTDGGTTMTNETFWRDDEAGAGEYSHADVHNITYNPLNNYLYACTDGGVARSTNHGSSWTFLSQDLHIMATYHADWYEPNDDIMACGTQDNGVNWRYGSTNTYRHVQGADGFDCLLDQDNTSDMVVSWNAAIVRSTDGGVTFVNRTPSGCGTFPQLARSFFDDNDIFAADGSSVYRSTNRGTAWTTETTPAGSRVLTTCQSNSERVYAGTGSTLWRSDDKGDTWAVKSGTPGYPTGVSITDVESRPSNSLIIWASFGGFTADRKVYSSNDGGDNWTNRTGSLPNVPCHSIAVDANNTVYVGTEVGVFVRPASETDWQPFLNGLPRSPVSELMVNNTAGTIIACTFGHGNFRSALYSTCPASGTLVVGGTIIGQRFYEYPTITSTSVITGGPGTDVAMKAMNYVQLNPGFEANSDNKFKAYTGPCGSGGNPLTLSNSANIDMEQIYIRADSTGRFPMANITSLKNNGTLGLKVKTAGNYSLRLVNEQGDLVKMVAENLQLQPGRSEHNFAAQLLHAGELHYVQLIHDNQILHFHEWR